MMSSSKDGEKKDNQNWSTLPLISRNAMTQLIH